MGMTWREVVVVVGVGAACEEYHLVGCDHAREERRKPIF